MTTNHFKTIAIAAAALGMSAAGARADIVHYEAQLRGANETPANPSRSACRSPAMTRRCSLKLHDSMSPTVRS